VTPVVHSDVVWGSVQTSGQYSGIRHAWRRHTGVWLPSLCGRGPGVLNTAALEAEEHRRAHLPRCADCVAAVERAA